MFDSRWMSESPCASRVDLFPHLEAFRVVGRHRTREDQLHVGDLLADKRYASMTPSGSFQGSYRLTWHSIGRSGSMPYCLTISRMNGAGRSRFFTDSGSMHGGACTMRSIESDDGTNSGMVHTDASCCST